MADGIAVFAPHANSYRRFRAQSYAPVAPTWGVNNRTVSLRVPAGPPESRHVEHRVAGADANPYLVAALVLAGMLRGIDAQSDPGPPVTGNGYAQNVVPRWPLHWPEALERAANAEFLADALGRGFLDVFRGDQAPRVREIRRARHGPRLRVVSRHGMITGRT